MTDAQRFLDTFLSNTASHYRGTPTQDWKSTPHGPKRVFRYTCINRAINLSDASNHLCGIHQIVAQPLLNDGTCYWASADNDNYVGLVHFVPPKDLPLNFSRSKSGGVHAVAVFETRQHAYIARREMERFARILGWWPCEINPKQTELTEASPKGNGVALPYFGMGAMPEIVRHKVTFTEPIGEETGYSSVFFDLGDDPNEAGYWSNDALTAMVTFYKENFPGFDFRRCRRGYAVPCPGNPKLGGWPDGAQHSSRDALISHEALVFIRNGWPKFRCVHAHCEQPKKTINHWREFWDPLRLWEFDEWLDAEMERLNHVG
jgi:hypothetical protein